MSDRPQSSLAFVLVWGFLFGCPRANGQGVLAADVICPMPPAAQIVSTLVSADCRTVAMVLHDEGNNCRILRNGQEQGSAADIPVAAISADGVHLAYYARQGGQCSVFVNGHGGPAFQAPLHFDPRMLVFSPDSERLAYIAMADHMFCVTIDGQQEARCEQVVSFLNYSVGAEAFFAFSGDSSKCAYVRRYEGKDSLVVDGKAAVADASSILGMSFGPRDEVAAVESLLLRDRFLVDGEALAEAQDIPCFALSSDGKHMAYAAERRDSNGRGPSAYNWHIVTDGRDSPPVHADHGHLPFPLVSQLTLSFDGSRLAYAKDESQGSNAGSFAVAECVVVDGKAGPQYALAECATFSPDGKHFAYCAERYKNVPTTNPGRYATVAKPVWVVVTDGSEGREYDLTSAPVFSPDSRHLAYAAEKDSQWSIIADGKEIAGYAAIVSQDHIGADDRYTYPEPCRFDAVGNLLFIGVREGQIYRVIYKPDDATTLPTTQP